MNDRASRRSHETFDETMAGAETVRGVREESTSILENVRDLNVRLIDMAWSNTNAVFEFDTGTDPSIAATEGNPSGIIEVHNGGSGASPLWYRPGEISPYPSTMSWSGSQQFDNHGYNPSIAV